MILLRLAIALLTIQSCSSQSTQWIVTHHEGQKSGFIQSQSDIGLITECQHSNIQIITSNSYIQKTISLRNFKPFAHTLVVIDYLRPQNLDVHIQIQNKTYDTRVINEIYKRSIIDDCLVGDIQYQEQSFVQEIFGNQLQELNIVMMGGKYNNNGFNMASEQKIAIKQIHILQIQCPKNCKRCVYLDNQAICTVCNDGFEHNNVICSCNGFKQNDICVDKCHQGYTPDSYQICQQTEYIKSINFQQNLRKIYRENESLDLEFDLENFRTFYIDIEVQIYNFNKLQAFQMFMNEGLYVYYLNIDSQNNILNLHEISYRDCESEQFCQVYHFKSNILQIEQSKLNFQANLEKKQQNTPQSNVKDQKSQPSYWKLLNLNINILMIQNEIPNIEHCKEIVKFGYNENKCIKCQAPFIALDGYCVEKCPLQSFKGDDICFDSVIQNTQILQLDEFKNYNQFQDEKYWFYNKESLISSLTFRNYQQNHLNKHYGITIQAKIFFIDYISDSKSIISVDNHQIVVIPKNQEYIGGSQNKPDSIVYLDQYIPHNNTDLTIEIYSQSYYDQSYITNFILIIHQCTPYCKSCTGPKKSECLEYETGLQEFNANSKNCNPGYFKTQGEYCMQCLDFGCLACQNGANCQQCKQGFKLTKYGNCDYI